MTDTTSTTEEDQPEGRFLSIQSGVAQRDGSPFCTVSLDDEPIGQWTPEQVRGIALGWIRAADAAEYDAAIIAQMTDPAGLKLELNVAAMFVSELRTRLQP